MSRKYFQEETPIREAHGDLILRKQAGVDGRYGWMDELECVSVTEHHIASLCSLLDLVHLSLLQCIRHTLCIHFH